MKGSRRGSGLKTERVFVRVRERQARFSIEDEDCDALLWCGAFGEKASPVGVDSQA
jgi:hypothetical protein